MKMNVEVEIDWMDEDGNIDTIVKNEIISAVSRNIKAGVLEKMKQRMENQVMKTIDKRVEKASDKIISQFLTRKFSVQDRYGDPIETGVTIKSRIKNNLEKYWMELVNKRGDNKDSYRDGPWKRRVEWYIDNNIEIQSKKFSETLTTDTENKIKNSMKKNLAETIGSKLVSELGLDKLLIESKENK